jgi:hypothetical protein
VSSYVTNPWGLSNFSTFQNVTSNTATVHCNPLFPYVINKCVPSVFTHCLSSGVQQTALNQHGVMQQLDCSLNDWQAHAKPASLRRSSEVAPLCPPPALYSLTQHTDITMAFFTVETFNVQMAAFPAPMITNPPLLNSAVCRYHPTEPAAHSETHLPPSLKCGFDWVVHQGIQNLLINIRGHLLYRILSKSDTKCIKYVYL